MTNADQPRKLEVFDVLRGVAILAVFGYHWHIDTVNKYVSNDGRIMSFERVTWEQLYASFSPLNYGSTGVQLFLVISGFLIHYNYLQRGGDKLELGMFFARRFWRIYPPYLLILIFFAFQDKQVTSYHFFTDTGRLSLVSHLLLTHNLFSNKGIFFGINPSFWSIGLEVQLYLIYPLFLALCRKMGIRRLCVVLFFVHLTAVFLIFLYKKGLPDSMAEMTFVGHYWIVWALGALMADSWTNKKRVFNISWTWWFVLVAGFMALQIFLIVFVYLSPILVAILWAALVELVLFEPPRMNWLFSRLKKPVMMIGLCSYSIYLIHQPLLRPLLKSINWADSSRFTDIINGGIIFAIVFFLSWGLYVFVEQPSIRLGQKLVGKSRGK